MKDEGQYQGAYCKRMIYKMPVKLIIGIYLTHNYFSSSFWSHHSTLKLAANSFVWPKSVF